PDTSRRGARRFRELDRRLGGGIDPQGEPGAGRGRRRPSPARHSGGRGDRRVGSRTRKGGGKDQMSATIGQGSSGGVWIGILIAVVIALLILVRAIRIVPEYQRLMV